MKLIDEKGRLFGAVNVVDLLVLLMIAAIVLVIATSFLGDKATEIVSQKQEYWFEVEVIGANPRLFNEVDRVDPVGATLIASNTFQDATIQDYWYEEFSMANPDSEGHMVYAGDGVRKNIVFLIKGYASPDSPTPTVANQEVRAGRTFIVKTQTIETSGVIRYCQFGGYDGNGGK
ncbi:MAG: DUF4330 domain-containing protein [Firmicutes bacterium]|nr:DUF4330 domain-containing protein [Bacillota bacterium]MBR0440557.1 DUF4330 domain-containing protein [Bacillota bacterium]